MDYYYHKFNDLQEEFHETIENYPLFEDDINYIFDYDIKEIEELLEKNDEYYLKKAISKLEDLIKEIKEKSLHIKKVYKEYDELVYKWQNLKVSNVPEKVLDKINHQVEKSSEYINKHSIDDIDYALKLFNKSIKELKEYTK